MYNDRFVGRRVELDSLRTMLAGAPLVTVAGPAGIGKTRLSVELTRGVGGDYPGGVYFCDLSASASVDAVCRALAAALDVPLLAARDTNASVIQLGHALVARGKCLVVLDNFEQIVALAATTVALWLAGEVRLLVTSREPLRVGGEVVFRLQPLAMPPDGSDAAELFAERVRAAGMASIDGRDPDVGEIVRTLEGIPLAIELAAARVGVLSPAELVELLPRSLDVLATARRDVAERHRTLRAAISWSWNLLESWERDALVQLSIFPGAFAVAAATEVIDTSSFEGAPAPLDVLQSLCDKSLVRSERVDGSSRFHLLSSVREFAASSSSTPRAAAVFARFRAHYARASRAFIAASAPRGSGGASAPVARAIEADLHNLLSIADAANVASPEELPSTCEALVAVGYVLSVKGPFPGYRELLDRALEASRTPETTGDTLALLRASRARMRRVQGDVAGAMEDARAAVSLAEAAPARAIADAALGLVLADRGALGESRDAYRHALDLLPADSPVARGALLVDLADLERTGGDIAASRATSEEALRSMRLGGERRGEGQALNILAIGLANEGRCDEAAERHAEAAAIFRSVGDLRMEAIACGNLAMLEQEDDTLLEKARASYERAIDILGRLGDRLTRSTFAALLGTLHHEAGRVQDALEHYEGALAVLKGARARSAGLGFAHVGAALADLGQFERAEEAFAEAERLLRDLDEPSAAALSVHRAHLDLARGDLHIAEQRRTAALAWQRSQPVRRALRLLERSRPAPRDTAALVVASDGSWFRPPGRDRTDLSTRLNLKRIVAGLAEARLREPGRALDAGELLALGWPGERVLARAGGTRVRVALATLRKLGLKSLLCSNAKGWWLDTATDVVCARASVASA